MDEPDRLYIGKTEEVPIDATLPFKFLAHGHLKDPLFWYSSAIEAYLNTSDINVITVDWHNHTFLGDLAAAYAAPQLAQFVSVLILELKANLDLPLDNVHLIGHSLGAHVFGLTGK